MTTAENIIKELMQALDKHTTNYNLLKDTDSIYILEVYYSDIEGHTTDTIKFIVDPSISLIVELDDDEEQTGAVFTVDGFITYVFS